MPGKNKRPRELWLRIRVRRKDRTPLNIPTSVVRDTLLDAIRRGDYVYPADWHVELQWRNKVLAPMKVGEFTAEMIKSRRSSVGWDSSVIAYLRGK